jgi:hypothetical protein
MTEGEGPLIRLSRQQETEHDVNGKFYASAPSMSLPLSKIILDDSIFSTLAQLIIVPLTHVLSGSYFVMVYDRDRKFAELHHFADANSDGDGPH